MADRFSNPSGSLGVHRFHVWPAGSDSYSHEELSENWDKADAMIGVPAGGTPWPPSEGTDGGIYREVKKLQHEREPIGMISHWFRPSTDVPLSILDDAGWHVCDGTTLGASDHDFPGVAGSVVLPDLRNKFVLGADPTKSIGAVGAAVSSVNINTATGAPGPQGKSGSNAVKLTSSQVPTHHHDLESTTCRVVVSDGIVYFGEALLTTTPILPPQTYPDVPTHSFRPALPTLDAGSDNPDGFDNRPNYIGLIPIIKVKYISTI